MIAVLLLAANVVAAQSQLEFDATVETVRLDVAVIHDDRPVLGLTADNFEVSDNGVRQVVRVQSTQSEPAAVILVFDTSDSVRGMRIDELRRAGRAVVAELDADTPAAFVAVGDAPRLAVAPTLSRAALEYALATARAEGGTSFNDALFAAFTMPVPTRRRIVVAFSDGDDTSSWIQDDALQRVVERADGWLEIVGLERAAETRSALANVLGSRGALPQRRAIDDPLTRRLADLAHATGGSFWTASDGELAETFRRLFARLRSHYVLAYEPRGVERTGAHEVKVRLRRASGRVHTRRHYFVPDPRE